MKKKFILYFILINFVSQHLQAREFNYDVYGLNFPFMKVQFSYSELNKVITKLESKGLLGFFSYFKGEGSSENLSDQFIYNFSYDKKKTKRLRTIVFKAGKVVKNIAIPKRKIKTKIVSVKEQDLEDSVDPLSAIRSLIFNQSNILNCNKKQKVFDGQNVYFLILSQKDKNDYVIDSSKLVYPGSMQKCKLSYKAVSGHEIEDEKKLNKMYVDIFYGKQNEMFLPYFLTTKSKITIEMFLN
jgi:hypothetical protein